MREGYDPENPCKAVVLEGAPEGYMRLGGYGVVFGGKDLVGDTFTPETKFWLDEITRTPVVMYQHGKDKQVGKAVLGRAHIYDPDDIGLWVESQIDLSNRYASAIARFAREGRLGYSSSSSPAVSERVDGKITSWPIPEITLTPTPMEPRTLGVTELKALFDLDPDLKAMLQKDGGEPSAEDESAGRQGETIPISEPIVTVEAKTMAENDAKTTQAEQYPGLEAMIMAAVTKAMQQAPGFDKALNIAPEQTDRPEEKSFADFLVAMQRHDDKRLKSVYKAALAEAQGSTGGYLVPPEYATDILRASVSRSVVRSQNPTIINMTSNEWNQPVLDYTGSTANTFPQLAGVRAYWTKEAATLTESEPTFETVKLSVNKLGGYTQAANEVRADAGATLESMLRGLFAEAIALYEDWAFINGNGVGQPLGVLNAPCLVTEVAASGTFVLSDIAAMLGKFHTRTANGGVWLMHPKVIEKLIALADGSGASNNLIWMNNGQVQGAPPMALMGKPIIYTDVMPVLPAGTSASQKGGVLLADWSYYLIGDRGTLEIAFSEHVAFTSDQGTWRFTKRLDGQPWLKQAIYLADGQNTVSPFVSLSGA